MGTKARIYEEDGTVIFITDKGNDTKAVTCTNKEGRELFTATVMGSTVAHGLGKEDKK